jgi:hypothetical protein
LLIWRSRQTTSVGCKTDCCFLIQPRCPHPACCPPLTSSVGKIDEKSGLSKYTVPEVRGLSQGGRQRNKYRAFRCTARGMDIQRRVSRSYHPDLPGYEHYRGIALRAHLHVNRYRRSKLIESYAKQRISSGLLLVPGRCDRRVRGQTHPDWRNGC